MAFASTPLKSGGSAGVQTDATSSTGFAAAANVCASITVPSAGWYDVEVVLYATTAGAFGTDDQNMALYSDAVTAGSVAFQRVIGFNPLVPAAFGPLAPIRTRVYAQSKINIQTLGIGTTGMVLICNMAVAPPGGGGEVIAPAVI